MSVALRKSIQKVAAYHRKTLPKKSEFGLTSSVRKGMAEGIKKYRKRFGPAGGRHANTTIAKTLLGHAKRHQASQRFKSALSAAKSSRDARVANQRQQKKKIKPGVMVIKKGNRNLKRGMREAAE